MQLLLGDLPRGALRPDAPGDIFGRCKCNEQGNRDCRIYTEAWPLSLTWLDGAQLVSRELAPCPNAPDFRLQMFHTYWDWTHEINARDTMTLARPARVALTLTLSRARPSKPPPGMHAWRRSWRLARGSGAGAQSRMSRWQGACRSGKEPRGDRCFASRAGVPACPCALARARRGVPKRLLRAPCAVPARRCAASHASTPTRCCTWRARPRTSSARATATPGLRWTRASACGTSSRP